MENKTGSSSPALDGGCFVVTRFVQLYILTGYNGTTSPVWLNREITSSSAKVESKLEEEKVAR